MTRAEIAERLRRLDAELAAGLEAEPPRSFSQAAKADLLASDAYRLGFLKSTVECARESLATLLELVERASAPAGNIDDDERRATGPVDRW